MIRQGLMIVTVLAMSACAGRQPKPVFYPNEAYQQNGAMAAEAAAQECMRLAESTNLEEHQESKMLGKAAGGAIVGAAVGAAVGSTRGHATEGLQAGAAGGATRGAFRGMAEKGKLNPLYVGFVEECLAERGYKTIGWK
ncbi:MAG: hypothetical protein L0Y32_06440 [Nevskiales bacterium]|nr:hypothetical protein [Nevskiales bacterium]